MGISQRILHNHRKNEIIYNLLKKFLLDGDRFLFGLVGLDSIPTLHPASCSGFPRSSDSSSRIVGWFCAYVRVLTSAVVG